MTHEFLSIYDAKLIEYLLALSYLALFAGFWTYVQGTPSPKKVRKSSWSFRADFHLLHDLIMGHHGHSEAKS